MGDTNIRIADEREFEVWDKIVDSSEMGTVFHKLDWHEKDVISPGFASVLGFMEM